MVVTHKNIKYKFFWNGIFSNWNESKFVFNGITFNCGEQFMMFTKAIAFKDNEAARKILNTESPKAQKKFGKEVKNFDSKVWDLVKYDLVKNGLREKFNQNPDMKSYLLKYKGYTLVEASPYDRIWGIGFDDLQAIDNIDKWGENLLGKILTELSNEM